MLRHRIDRLDALAERIASFRIAPNAASVFPYQYSPSGSYESPLRVLLQRRGRLFRIATRRNRPPPIPSKLRSTRVCHSTPPPFSDTGWHRRTAPAPAQSARAETAPPLPSDRSPPPSQSRDRLGKLPPLLIHQPQLIVRVRIPRIGRRDLQLLLQMLPSAQSLAQRPHIGPEHRISVIQQKRRHQVIFHPAPRNSTTPARTPPPREPIKASPARRPESDSQQRPDAQRRQHREIQIG